MLSTGHTLTIVDPADALPGRDTPEPVSDTHFVLGTATKPPFPDGLQQAVFGMGCFWAAEQLLWTADGVYTTAVGYTGGYTPNPTYEEVETERTGHTEAVLVVFDPATTSYEALLKLFWENHDPTQGMRDGDQIGTWYRSALYYLDDAQRVAAEHSRETYGARLAASGHGAITTELAAAGPFYYAEDDDQQYRAKNPEATCRLGGTGVSCPMGLPTS